MEGNLALISTMSGKPLRSCSRGQPLVDPVEESWMVQPGETQLESNVLSWEWALG